MFEPYGSRYLGIDRQSDWSESAQDRERIFFSKRVYTGVLLRRIDRLLMRKIPAYKALATSPDNPDPIYFRSLLKLAEKGLLLLYICLGYYTKLRDHLLSRKLKDNRAPAVVYYYIKIAETSFRRRRNISISDITLLNRSKILKFSDTQGPTFFLIPPTLSRKTTWLRRSDPGRNKQ